jgi:hypothetical protein
MTFLDFNWIFGHMRKTNPVKNWIPVFNWIRQTSTFGPHPVKIQFIRLRTRFFAKDRSKRHVFFLFFCRIRPIYECRCDERLKPKGEEST